MRRIASAALNQRRRYEALSSPSRHALIRHRWRRSRLLPQPREMQSHSLLAACTRFFASFVGRRRRLCSTLFYLSRLPSFGRAEFERSCIRQAFALVLYICGHRRALVRTHVAQLWACPELVEPLPARGTLHGRARWARPANLTASFSALWSQQRCSGATTPPPS